MGAGELARAPKASFSNKFIPFKRRRRRELLCRCVRTILLLAKHALDVAAERTRYWIKGVNLAILSRQEKYAA